MKNMSLFLILIVNDTKIMWSPVYVIPNTRVLISWYNVLILWYDCNAIVIRLEHQPRVFTHVAHVRYIPSSTRKDSSKPFVLCFRSSFRSSLIYINLLIIKHYPEYKHLLSPFIQTPVFFPSIILLLFA